MPVTGWLSCAFSAVEDVDDDDDDDDEEEEDDDDDDDEKDDHTEDAGSMSLSCNAANTLLYHAMPCHVLAHAG